ncbi:SphA family protein [Acinetobacter sp. ANC 3813]|uniref:SphA family protein n=1 Tax=Acinetobacter sp. ANC 3813 TaxID=1977873 RepID=UPI000A356161|nr:transporter [Acinetobacter sp. ANC 3813]OTG87362.1 hypothetical protein B9T34_16730 [Acinetobacter sp. ANC 3813]
MIYKKILFGILCTLSTSLFAVENGNSSYANGAENFMSAVVPPPGFYGMVYLNHYNSDQLNDYKGNNLNVPNFEVQSTALVSRLVWVTNQNFFGGDLIFEALIPIVDLKVQSLNMSERQQGLGDITIGSALGFHHSPNLHSAIGFDIFLPAGDYDKNNLANISLNRTTIEPMYTISYLKENSLSADLKLGYLFNGKNSDTNYSSGDQFHLDYSIGQNFKNMTFGIGGYYSTQINNDKINGEEIKNSKTNGFALGPSFKYQGKNWFTTVKWEKEIVAENKSKGDSIWIKAALPF